MAEIGANRCGSSAPARRCTCALRMVRHLHPIAGDAGAARPRRGRRPGEDLLADPKSAEHVMLVDLGRNDLGRVSSTAASPCR